MRDVRITLEDVRVKVSELRAVGVPVIALMASDWVLHRVGNGVLHIDNNYISDLTALFILPTILWTWRRYKNRDVSRTLDVAGSLLAGTSQNDAAGQAQEMHKTKNIWTTALDPGLSAKHFLLFGTAPPSESRHAILELIRRREALLAPGTPFLEPSDALRIMRTIADGLDDRVSDALDAAPDAEAWKRKTSKLRRRMAEARYLMSAQREERAGNPLVDVSLRNADFPTQDQIASYFFLTGHVPEEEIGGRELQKRINGIRRLDPTVPRKAVLNLISSPRSRDAIMPIRPMANEPWRTFPVVPEGGGQADAVKLYKSRLDNTGGFRDSFVGRDGWHYMTFRSQTDRVGQETILAAREHKQGDRVVTEAVMLHGRLNDVSRWWELMKMDRAQRKISILEKGSAWRGELTAELKSMRAEAARVRNPVTYTWPHAMESPEWASSRRRRQAWLDANAASLPGVNRALRSLRRFSGRFHARPVQDGNSLAA